MDVPTSLPRGERAETVRDALGTMETHMTWIEGILMLLKREAEDIRPDDGGLNDALSIRLNFLAHSLGREHEAVQGAWQRAWDANKGMIRGEERADA